jgi:hypothetical protein
MARSPRKSTVNEPFCTQAIPGLRRAVLRMRSRTFGDAVARMLVMVTPGGFHRFFEELSSLNRGLPAPDLARTEQLMNSYGIELLGPPLS